MTPFRIATYNLWFGGSGRVDEIHTVLAHINADIIALTEADDPHIVADLADRLNLHHIWAEGSGDRHIATLSRYPIQNWHIHKTPPLSQAVLETHIQLPTQTITIYNAHFLPYLLLPFEIRRWQAVGKLLQIIASRPTTPHLIIGDLNAIGPQDRVLQHRNPGRMRRIMWLQAGLIFRLAIPRLLRAGYTDCFRHLHPNEDGFTWWTVNPTTRYDYIMASPSWQQNLVSCHVVDHPATATASDHFPLLAEFA